MSFMPSVTADLASIDFAMGLASGTNEVDLSLVNDNGGLPTGSPLESWTINNLCTFGNLNPVLTVAAVSHPLRQDNVDYAGRP